MTDREKLIELLRSVQYLGGLEEKIANHLIAHGVTVLPCKIGEVVWGIKKYNKGQEAKQGVVYQMFFGEDMRLCVCVKNVCRGEWGSNVFLTKEEAEAHLPQPPKGE